MWDERWWWAHEASCHACISTLVGRFLVVFGTVGYKQQECTHSQWPDLVASEFSLSNRHRHMASSGCNLWDPR